MNAHRSLILPHVKLPLFLNIVNRHRGLC